MSTDPVKDAIWLRGTQLLGTGKAARSFLGALRRDFGDDVALLDAMQRCEASNVLEPRSWLRGSLRAFKKSRALTSRSGPRTNQEWARMILAWRKLGMWNYPEPDPTSPNFFGPREYLLIPIEELETIARSQYLPGPAALTNDRGLPDRPIGGHRLREQDTAELRRGSAGEQGPLPRQSDLAGADSKKKAAKQ